VRKQSEKIKVIKENIEYEFEAAKEGGYVANVPGYPSCVSQGETLNEALANIEDALIGCLLAARDLKLPIPPQFEFLLKQEIGVVLYKSMPCGNID
jgi:predicted RNase H-like HicB family nuclease